MKSCAWILMIVLIQGCAGSKQPSDRWDVVNTRIDDVQRSLALLNKSIEQMNNDVMILQDQMESTRIQVQKLEHHGLEKAAALKAIKKVKSQPPLIYIKSVETDRTNARAAKKNDANENEAIERYKEAFKLYEDGKLNKALEQFEDFVKKHPGHDYADNAIYWMGESYYDQKEYLLAITEFKRVLKRYPQSNKVADALLKIGYAYEQLEDKPQARKAFVKVLEEYPYTAAAQKAAARLEKIARS